MHLVTPRKLLIVDGLGATLSGALLLGILRPYHEWIGLPAESIELLGQIALTLAFYSFSVFFFFKKSGSVFFGLLYIFNLCYVLYTISLIFQHYRNLTRYGWAYFSGELMVILFLAYLEWSMASKGTEIQT